MSTGVIITIIICSTVIILSGLNVLSKWVEHKKKEDDEEC